MKPPAIEDYVVRRPACRIGKRAEKTACRVRLPLLTCACAPMAMRMSDSASTSWGCAEEEGSNEATGACGVDERAAGGACDPLGLPMSYSFSETLTCSVQGCSKR